MPGNILINTNLCTNLCSNKPSSIEIEIAKLEKPSTRVAPTAENIHVDSIKTFFYIPPTPEKAPRWDDKWPQPVRGIYDSKTEAIASLAIGGVCASPVIIGFGAIWGCGWVTCHAADKITKKIDNIGCFEPNDNYCVCPLCPDDPTPLSSSAFAAPQRQEMT